MRRLAMAYLLVLAGCVSGPRLRPFSTDGCSLFPNGTPERENLWLHCCTAHDRRYWAGGTKAERRKADIELQECVAAAGRPKTAKWMMRGVRAGGTPYLPTTFRWGYGWRYLRGYRRLSDHDKDLIERSQRLQ